MGTNGRHTIKVLIDNGHGDPPLTGGKQSPDGRVKEYKWAREMASRLDRALTLKGVDSIRICVEETDVPITERVSRVNKWCEKLGARNVLLISIHNNAAGADGSWHEAHGWQVYVSKNASERSKRFAQMLTAEAEARKLVNPRSRQPGGYWTWSWRKDDIGLLKKTLCPAVLVENMFMDNEADANLLVSEEGKQMLLDVMINGIMEYVEKG